MVEIPVLLKSSSTSGQAPLVGEVLLRELAVNTHDGKLYMKKDDGSESIVEIGKLINDGSPELAAALDAGSFQINDLADPSLDQDAATKKYVDDKFHDYSARLFVDGEAASSGDGSYESPYQTIQEAINAIGPPTTAAEYQQNFIIDITPGTYTEDLTVPYRAIMLRGMGVTIDGTITREIAAEEEFGVSSSTWRAAFAIVGFEGDGRNSHQRMRYGMTVNGNVRTTVKSGMTGNTTHDSYYKNVRFNGTYTVDDGTVNGAAPSVGNHIVYLDGARFSDTVEGRQIYVQDMRWCEVGASTFIVGWMVQITNTMFTATSAAITVESGFGSGAEARWLGDDFAATTWTVPAGQTIYVDDITKKSFEDNATWAVNTPTITSLEASFELTADSIDETHIQLSNTGALVGLNNAGDGDVALIKANASDQAELPTETLVSGNMTLDSGVTFDSGGNKLTNAADPTLDQDVATKKYVDDEVASAITTAMNYQGTADASAVDADTATGTSSHSNGDLYRITTAGSTAFGEQYDVGDYTVYNGSSWDRIDAVDPTVSGTSDRVTVTGDDHDGYVIDIAATFGLSGLADVDPSGVADGDILQYNATNSAWEVATSIDGGSY
jgi:hypothetical protein